MAINVQKGWSVKCAVHTKLWTSKLINQSLRLCQPYNKHSIYLLLHPIIIIDNNNNIIIIIIIIFNSKLLTLSLVTNNLLQNS